MATTRIQSFGYDAVSGRLRTVSDTTNSAEYSYLANSPLVEYVYHKNGQTTRMTTQKAYDSVNRLTSIANFTNSTVVSSRGYQYSSVNLRTSITNEDKSYWTNGYNAQQEVIASKRHWSDHHPVAGQQYAFAYDGIGNRQTSWEGGNKWGGGLRESVYTANSLNQYTQRLNPGAYDVIGKATNAVTVTLNYRRAERHGDYFHLLVTTNNETSPLYVEAAVLGVLNGDTTNDLDIVTTSNRNLLLPPGTQTFQYDADGNLTNNCLWTYVWDGENRLTAMESLTTVPAAARQRVEFTYDWQGRRIQKAAYTWNTGTSAYVLTTKVLFLYDGWNPAAQLNATNGAVMQSYLWGLDLSGTGQGAGGVGGLLAISDAANGAHFAGYDGNGNVTGLVSATNSAVTAQYEYSPFGESLCV